VGTAAKHENVHQLRHDLVSGYMHRKGYHLTEDATWIGYFRVATLAETMNDLAFFVFAGGQSSRMGRDKALLMFEGITLLQRALRTCAEISPDVWIVGQASKYGDFGQTIEDIHSDCGPIAGIHAALTKSTSEFNVVLAVDMPYVSARLLAFLSAQARAGDAVVTVPEVDMRLQPLCAVYRREFLPVAESAIASGIYKITPLFEEVSTRVILPEEFKIAGFSSDVFRNWNSPADLERDSKIKNS
jgi:molybdopterin-guanine dinucleotide biosynthesis protein A